MIKRLIFDIDGTLIQNIDFRPFIINSLKKYGIYKEENVNNFIHGINTYENNYNNYNKKDYLNYLSSCLNVKLDSKFLDIFFEELKGAINTDNNELINLLEYLSKKYELVILSNYFKESQLNRLRAMQIDKYFSYYFGDKLIKPNKDCYIKACGNNKLEECVIIGNDINLDVKIPISIGLKAIWFSKAKSIKDIKIISNLRELKDML